MNESMLECSANQHYQVNTCRTCITMINVEQTAYMQIRAGNLKHSLNYWSCLWILEDHSCAKRYHIGFIR